ncbi:NEAT domain-containing protein [Phocea massiliensis]|uniref:NEAT domain-containing protein n=1 Tax=Merdimmobilis hominis TaxID=2897707 RepID=A0A938X888_9FIRM|nr:NEAT domain-containing protein [Merdimmobilis hominis]
MTTAKQSLLKRGLAAVMATVMTTSLCSANVFASESKANTYPEGSREVKQLTAPVEDGVYTASINMMNANSNGSYSMGNAALRGSESFLQKNPDDTEYQSLVIVEDGKATALVEFMPMGYIGQYGFMMELESATPEILTKYGYPDDDYCVFTPAEIMTEHRTQLGTVVYDPYNNPDSEYVYDGSDPATMTRPAGYGHDEERLINIADQPYSHLMALDVTPVVSADKDGNISIPENPEDFTVMNAAYVHVFVPIMFSISPTSGDQYARMQVDWTTVEKVENPESNLTYQFWKAQQIEQGNYTADSYDALRSCVEDIQTKLTNIWPDQTLEMSGTGFTAVPVLNMKEYTAEEQADMAAQLVEAVSALEVKGDKSALNDLLAEAEEKEETAYTPSSWKVFSEKVDLAKQVQLDSEASTAEVTKAVEELTNGMNGLVERADTAELNNLIQEAELIKNNGYTEYSWNQLQTAIQEAKALLANADASQNEVNNQTAALQQAMDSLKKDGELDKNNLEDGVYSIYGEMVKVNRKDFSMSNDAINHTVKLTVENGQYYLTMDFKGLSYLNKFGYLAELAYYDNGFVYDQYGEINGTLIAAEVLSTQKNADGTDVMDEFNQTGGSYEGKLYPDQVKFSLVSDALNDEDGCVPLQVFVPVMEDISAGSGTQNVLLKLDWSTLKETTEDDPDFQPEEPVEQSPAVNVTDSTTGIKVEADKGVFPEGVEQVVTQITSGADYDRAASILSDVGKKFRLFEIHFELNGAEVQPNGIVTVYYPIPEGYDADKVVLYRINEDGTKTLVKGTVENGFYKVMTKSFSTYALVEQGSTITDAENSANVGSDIPQTGDSTNVLPFALLALASGGMIGVLFISRKRKFTEGE